MLVHLDGDSKRSLRVRFDSGGSLNHLLVNAGLFQAGLISQDGCKRSNQHNDLAPGHEEMNRRPTPDT